MNDGMGTVVDETTDGRFRVVLFADTDPQAPDHDGQGYVLGISWRTYGAAEVSVEYAPTGDPFADDLASRVSDALRRWGNDWDRIERYARMFWDVVSVDRCDTLSGDTYLELVTAGMCDAWGIPAGAPIRAESANLSDWRAYTSGDVYGYVVEERTTWRKDGTDETREEWEHVDSCGGFYGREYAVESAREQLA